MSHGPALTDLARLDDGELLALAAGGDAHAFAAIHERHAGHAYAAARRILGPGPAAEDVVQEALLQLWREAGRYLPERGSLRSWIIVLVRSRALDLLRRERVRTAATERAQVQDVDRGVAAAADEEAGLRERARALCSGLAGLPREQGEVLGMLYLGGRTQAEVAATLDLPLGTVKGRTRLGLGKLRRSLEGAVAA